MLNNLKIYRYKEIKTLFWPIALTLILTNTLSFVDTLMVSNYNILASAAINSATQVQFLFGPVYFAMLSGVNIYIVQYFSRNETKKLKNLGGISLTMLLSLACLNFTILIIFGNAIVKFFSPSNEVYHLASSYLNIFKFSILLMPIDMFFTYQYRAIKKPKIPLIIGTMQSLLNIFFNLLFIYGIFIFPELGIAGAALGTLISRIITIVVHFIVSKKINVPFIGSFSEMFNYKFSFFKEVLKNTIPLIIVELGFGLSNVIYFKLYSLTSVIGLTAFTISRSISFILNAFVIATANVCGIITGSTISKGLTKDSTELKKTMNGLFKFMSFNSVFIFIMTIFILPLFIPIFLNRIDSNNFNLYFNLIYKLLIINAFWMSIRVFSSSLIAILKSGSDNKFVMLVDAGSSYLVGIPISLVLVIFFNPTIVVLRSVIIIETITKLLLGIYRYNQKKWVKKI